MFGNKSAVVILEEDPYPPEAAHPTLLRERFLIGGTPSRSQRHRLRLLINYALLGEKGLTGVYGRHCRSIGYALAERADRHVRRCRAFDEIFSFDILRGDRSTPVRGHGLPKYWYARLRIAEAYTALPPCA